ncbi:unnamed protein product [Clonostachys byssicola]|uniref:Uncharacterized protein n=1 Tax=Clonostachys byssicola TaxID=160290 RepID=A0A9N9Y326_9HYPO|nr:unnamed protein product [Clonostachys byssicola]
MWCYFFLVLLQATIALAQQSYGTLPDTPPAHAFEFHGCASVNLNSFSDPIVFLDVLVVAGMMKGLLLRFLPTHVTIHVWEIRSSGYVVVSAQRKVKKYLPFTWPKTL